MIRNYWVLSATNRMRHAVLVWTFVLPLHLRFEMQLSFAPSFLYLHSLHFINSSITHKHTQYNMADNVRGLLADDSASAQDAASKIASPCINAIEKGEDPSKIEHELNTMWSAILTAAEQTPHDRQDKLVQIMHAIKALSPSGEKSKKFVVWDNETSWDELPLFGAAARERLDVGMFRSTFSQPVATY